MSKKLSVISLSLLLSACAVGPDYKGAPELAIGTDYKSAQAYQQAAAKDWAQISRDDLSQSQWWTRFNDEILNQLMQTLNQSNYQLEQALANYDASQASLRSAQSGFWPTLGTNASYTRSGGDQQTISDKYSGSASLSWELDLWGKVRRQVEANRSSTQASAADVEHTRLSLQGQLAKAYFGLRMSDEQQKLLNQIVQSYEKSLRVNQNRYTQGVAARADVVSATAQLESARAQAISIQSTRQQYESTIALLLGKAPSQVNIPIAQFKPTIPTVPSVLPSALLSRRPDIYSAERSVAQANAEIGVAQAAWLPSLNLGLSGGLAASALADWLSAPLNFWSLGPQLALSIFDGGARSAAVASSKAQYRAKVAAYRQTVLTALKEVEDNMTKVSVLSRQAQVQQRALSASRESLQITRNQYQAGLVNYLNVTQVENSAYNNEINHLQLMNQRLDAAVDLILALGGGWTSPNVVNEQK